MAYTKQNFVDEQILTHVHLNHIEDGIANIWETIYPVGSVYMSMNSTSPAQLFGGTWQQRTDRFLVAAGNAYAAGDVGGSSTNTHGHWQTFGYDGDNIYFSLGAQYTDSKVIQDVSKGYLSSSASTGGVRYDKTFNETIDTRPPYLAVYMWIRTA